jgi:hypothetical protein
MESKNHLNDKNKSGRDDGHLAAREDNLRYFKVDKITRGGKFVENLGNQF